jgi:hypothetical protein
MAKLEFKSRRCEVNDDGLSPKDIEGLCEDSGEGWEVVGMTALPPGNSALILLKRPAPTDAEVLV